MQIPDFRQNPQIQENSSKEIPVLHFYYKNVIGKTCKCKKGLKIVNRETKLPRKEKEKRKRDS